MRSYYSVINALIQFLTEYLQVTDVSTIKASFFSESDDVWSLKSKKNCLSEMEYHLKDRLINEQYVVLLDYSEADDFDFRRVSLRFKNEITVDEFERVFHFFSQKELNYRCFDKELNRKSTQRVLLSYPWILLRALQGNLHLLSKLPLQYKLNDFFMREAFDSFQIEIEQVLRREDRQALLLLMSTLFQLDEGRLHFCNLISDAFSWHQDVRALCDRYKQDCLNESEEKMGILMTLPSVTLSELMQLTKKISPDELSTVILNRRGWPHLEPLPYCDNHGVLVQFCRELALHQSWDTYLHFKQRLLTCRTSSLAQQYLLSTEHWFLAFMRYQHHHSYFDSRHDVQVHFSRIMGSLNEQLNYFIPYVFLPALMFVVLLPLKEYLLSEGQLNSSCGLNRGRAIVALMVSMTIGLAFIISYLEENPLFQGNNLCFSSEITRFFCRGLNSLVYKTSMPFTADLLTRCEDSIFRLKGLDSASAHEKAALLNEILMDVKEEETVAELSATEVEERLQEKRHIAYGNKMLHVSFWSVAAQPRRGETFEPTMPGEHVTTTVKHLRNS